MSQTYQCRCGEAVAKVDRRYKQPLRPLNGATLERAPKQAPRLRCKCGSYVVLWGSGQ